MKTKFLFISLISILGLSGCVVSNDDSTSDSGDPSTTTTSSGSILDEILEAADNFTIQDYKTFDYELFFTYDLSLEGLGAETCTASYKFIIDTTTSGDYYYYYSYQIGVGTDSDASITISSEQEIFSYNDTYYYLVISSVSSDSALDIYPNDAEEDIKESLDASLLENQFSKDDIITLTSSITDADYSKNGDDFVIDGVAILENLSFINTFFSSLEYDIEGAGSQKLGEDYKNASVDYDVTFNSNGYVLSENAVVEDAISVTTTTGNGDSAISMEYDMTNISVSRTATYDEEVERVNLYYNLIFVEA